MGILACTMPGGACDEIGNCYPCCNVARGVLIWTQVPYSSGGFLPGSPGPGDPTVLLRFRQVRSVDIQQQQLNSSIVPSVADGIRAGLSLRVTMCEVIVPVEARRYPDPPYLWGQLCAKLAPSAAGSNQTAHTEGSMRGLTTNNRILGVLRGPLDFRRSESRRVFLRCGSSQWRCEALDAVTIRVHKALAGVGTVELARRAGVSRYTAWRWEHNRPHVSPEVAERLTRALFQPAGTPADPGSKAA